MKIKAILLLFLLSIIVYSNSLGGDFISDDEYFVVKNINIRNLENFPSFFTNPSAIAFEELSEDVYRPITALSYAIDYFLWKLNTFGYHLQNVLFHSFNTILLFLFLYYAFGNYFFAVLSAIFFTCHPIETEVVSWISGRSSVLFLFFYLSAFLFYVRFLKGSKKVNFLYSLILYTFSLFSKEMAVSFPLLLIAYDAHFFNKGSLRERIYRYAPYFMLTLLFIFARYAVTNKVSQCGWWGNSPYYTFLSMAPAMLKYVGLLILPAKLCVFYTPEIVTSIADTRVLSSLIFLALVAISLPFFYKRIRIVSFSICWFFVTLLPVSNIIPLRALMAERFLYLPSIGFCMLLAIMIEKLSLVRVKSFSHIGKAVSVLAAIILVVSYSARTIVRNEDWKNSMTLAKKIIEVYPLSSWAYTSMGSSYLALGYKEEAVKSLKKAILLSRNFGAPRSLLGHCYLEMGRYEDAIEMFNEDLRARPRHIETINSIGVAYGSMKKYDEAIKYFESSIKMDPTFVNAYLNLGATYEFIHEYDKALEEYNKIILNTKSKQEIAVSYIRTGDLYKKMKLDEKAGYYYKKAVDTCSRGLEYVKKVAEEKLNAIK